MKTILILLALMSLTGCGTVVGAMGSFYDRQDPCQLQNVQRTGYKPNYCGASQGGTVLVIRDYKTEGIIARGRFQPN